MTLDEFAKLVAKHDLTFDYSDDRGVRERGSRELSDIKECAKAFPREDVVRIWNAEVDRKLHDGTGFYWEV